MGWVDSSTYFCAALEMAQDLAMVYPKTVMGTMPVHKSQEYTWLNSVYGSLPSHSINRLLWYLYKAYVDDFMVIAITSSHMELDHLVATLPHGIHDVFPPTSNAKDNPILLKMLKQYKGVWALWKELLEFIFDGSVGCKTIWPNKSKWEMLLTTMTKWIKMGDCHRNEGIPFLELYLVIYKICHAFIAILNSRGLFSPTYGVIWQQPAWVYIHQNKHLLHVLCNIQPSYKSQQ